MIDLVRAIKYPFAGQTFLAKTLIGALLVLFMPVFFVTGFVLLGYQLRIIRDVIDGRDDELPEWDNIFGDFVQGIVVFLGSLVYYFPTFILAGLGAAAALKAVAGVGTGIEAALDPFTPETTSSFELDRVALSMMCVYFALGLIWALLSAPLLMAATARYAETGQFSAYLDVLQCADEVWEQRGQAAMLAFNLFVLAILVQIVSVFASVTCLAGFYLQFFQMIAIFHLTGQWGAILKANRPKPSVIRPINAPRR